MRVIQLSERKIGQPENPDVCADSYSNFISGSIRVDFIDENAQKH